MTSFDPPPGARAPWAPGAQWPLELPGAGDRAGGTARDLRKSHLWLFSEAGLLSPVLKEESAGHGDTSSGPPFHSPSAVLPHPPPAARAPDTLGAC